VRHIATVNLFYKSYSWRISQEIANSNNYVIRISVGANIARIWLSEKNLANFPSVTETWPVTSSNLINWDESDKVFEIGGEIKPECPNCQCPNSQNIENVMTILQNMIAELQKAIALLK
jgi:hypothetical protein